MSIFTLNYSVTGDERKRLVKAIAAHTGADAKYLGVPSCAYQVDYFTISKDGSVSFDDRADSEEIESLIEALAAQGFTAEAPADDDGEETGKVAQNAPDAEEAPEAASEANNTDETGLTISVPLGGFNPDSLDRLQKLIDSKAALIKKAQGADRLTVRTRDGKVEFPWWDTLPEPEEVQAYTAFIAALCRMAKEAKRVTATEKDVESEKYAFRGFLLRLGFIGAESKAHRRILLKNLSGASAFPNKAAADAFAAAQKAKRDAAKGGRQHRGGDGMRFPSRETVELVRREYPAGTLVELVKMDDPQAPPVGTIGEVLGVDDTGSLLMRWRTGSGLNVVYGEDVVRKL